jgi:cytochrome c oxidase assembly protein subunit 15
MPSSAASRAARVFFLLTIFTWAQIAFGALVRAKQAGLSCPDWPLCHGALVPNLKLTGVVYEYGHRLFATVVSALYLLGAWLGWRDVELRRKFSALLIGLGVLLFVQAVFGGLTVLLVDKSSGIARPATWTVVSHLLLGNTFAALSLLTALQLRDLTLPELPAPRVIPQSVRVLAGVWAFCLVLQMTIGGTIAGSLQGLACAEFPNCNAGVWFPSLDGYVGVQILHRCNAYWLVVLGWTLAYKLRGTGRLGQVADALGWLILAQVSLGAMNIWSLLKPHITTAHSLVAALLFSTTAVLVMELRRTQPGRLPSSHVHGSGVLND